MCGSAGQYWNSRIESWLCTEDIWVENQMTDQSFSFRFLIFLSRRLKQAPLGLTSRSFAYWNGQSSSK